MKNVRKVVVLLLAFSLLLCEFGGRPVKAATESEDEYIDWVEEEEPIEVDEDVLDSWEEEEEAWDDDDVYDEEEEDDDEGDDEDDYYIDDTISVNMDIKERWENHYNAEVTVTNLTDETIDNWAVAFDYGDEIEHIWNAQITAHEENSYTIKCLDWNQDIPANGSVSFGITAKHTGETGDILNEYLINDTVEINEDNYSVTYHESSAWPGFVSGEIRVENKSDLRIEDWKLEIATNLDIQQIWNASIESEYTNDENEKVYLFKNMGYNQNIEARQTCSFGFIAKKSSGDVKVEAQELLSVSTSGLDEEEEDWETPEAVEGLTEDDFLEYSDYLDYIASQGGGNMLRSRAKAAKKTTEAVPKKTIARKVSAVYEVKGGKPKYRKKAFQNFCMGKIKGKDGTKYAYGVVHCGKNAVMMKMKLKEEKGEKKVAKIIETMRLKNCGHTQSLESFVYKDGEKEKEYFLLTGKTYVLTKEEKKKAQQAAKNSKKKLSQILKNFCTQVVCVEFKDGATVDEEKCGKLVGVAHSNKKKKSFGRLNRVDIGLKGEDRIVIWKRRKEDQAVQVSTYSFGSKIKEKLVQKKKISFANSKSLKYKTGFTMKKDTTSYILPNSTQSIDQGGDNTIYIASGKQDDYELCIAECSADKGVYRKKYTFKFKKKTKKTIKEKSHFPIQGKKEIEGMHSKGDQLQFVIADSEAVEVTAKKKKNEKSGKKVTMKRQYICQINK